jgi:hypothetical protein
MAEENNNDADEKLLTEIMVILIAPTRMQQEI